MLAAAARPPALAAVRAWLVAAMLPAVAALLAVMEPPVPRAPLAAADGRPRQVRVSVAV